MLLEMMREQARENARATAKCREEKEVGTERPKFFFAKVDNR
jgi:hypothetical protein